MFVLIQLCLQQSHQVSAYAYMRCCVRTICRQSYFKDEIFLDVEINRRRSSCLRIVFQHHYSVIIIAQTEFLFRTNHSLAQFASQFGFLYFEELFIRCINLCPDSCDYNLLSFRNIGSSANDIQRTLPSHIDSRQMQVVGIRVHLARQYLSHEIISQPAFYCLYSLDTFDFQTSESQQLCHLFCRNVYIDILPQPII